MLTFLAAIADAADREKCEALYYQYRNLMYYIAYHVLRDEAGAEDAVQRAFVKIIDYLQKIGEVDCPKTESLMVIIVKRVAIDEYNRRKKRGEAPYDELAEREGVEDAPDTVTAAILRLPPLYAETLGLRYIQGFSARETARLLGAEESAIQKRIARGKEKLRALLEEEGYDVP